MRLRHPRFMLFLAVLVSVLGASAVFIPWARAIIAGFDAAALVYLLAAMPLWQYGTPAKIRESAADNDGGRTLLLCIAATVSGAILVALTIVIKNRSALTVFDIALVLLTVVLAWLFANTVFTFHYAHLFYDAASSGKDRGGLDFPGTDEPSFADFIYFSFMLGMTFQVSDVSITSSRIRRVATFHGLLAFFFNIGVLALTVNVLATAL